MKVLLIEDDDWLTGAVKESFDGVVSVRTLAQAIDYLMHRAAHLILVDLNLPDSKGLDTLKALVPYAVPKVVLSATNTVCTECAALGARDYITKTGDINQILERIGFNLARVSKRSERFAPESFEEIKACFCLTTEGIPANIGA